MESHVCQSGRPVRPKVSYPHGYQVHSPERKTLESPLDSKEIQPVHPKGNQSEYPLEGLMLKVKLQYFGHLMRRADSFEKSLMLGKID